MKDQTNLVIDSFLFLKHYKRKDGRQQVMIRIKTGYSHMGKKVITKTYDIQLLSKNRSHIRMSKEEFFCKESYKDIMLRFYEVDELIRKAIIQFNRENRPVTTKGLTDFIYNKEHSKKPESSGEYVYNDFLEKHDLPPMPVEAYDDFISKEHIDADTNEPVMAEDLEAIGTSFTAKFYDKQHRLEIEKMPYTERYEKGHYDQSNIFDLFGYCWSLKKKNKQPLLNREYRSTLIRIYDYRYNVNPPENITDFNKRWASDFIEFMAEKGYAHFHPKNYSPFSLEQNKIQFINSERSAFKISSFKKHVKHFKRYINLLQDLEIVDNKINTRLIDATDYINDQINTSAYTRREHALTVEEFEQLCNAKLNNEFDLARDMFIIAVLGGGFRGEEFYNQQLSFEKRNGRYFTRVYHSKNQVENFNPAFGELLRIIDKYNGKMPKFLDVDTFRERLKTIAEKLNFTRTIYSPNTLLNAEDKFIKTELKEIFSIYFARKTCVKYLGYHGFTDDEIIEFTRHADTRTLRFYKGAATEDDKLRTLKAKGLL